ncbi:MAG: calcium/sodium antiporter [Flavobacteriales bacterium]|nr:calcium/sodium antiporter [Flavobacteriales bacterium]
MSIYLLLLAGFAILMVGGELLVRGAAGLALKAKISPLVVGLTVVSIGTSAPELFASLQAVWQGSPEICVGNVIGSNIANLGLVLAITVLIFPITVDRQVLRQDWPMMLIATLAFYIFSLDGRLSFLDGLIFTATLALFTIYLIVRSRMQAADREHMEETEEFTKVAGQAYWKLLGLIGVGCVGLYFGSEWFLEGAIGVATQFGVSDHVIGVTVVAFGTSVPELAASGIAAFRKQSDISLGNLVGSNIFNLLGVLGVTAMTGSLPISDTVMHWDYFWVLGVALLLFPMMFFKGKIGRIDGLILLASYVAYITFLVI